ncbi:MAG: hypothetical protein LBF05_05400 [Tannerella sp.]|jgi:hypothetical protein|nr:hypothetical protein [Tannerella sp.]
MTSAEIYQWMADPSLLTKSSLLELKQMVDEFPYFHAVRMLYLKNLAVLDDVRLGKELKKMAVFIPDRRQLFTLIDDFNKSKHGEGVIKQKKSVVEEEQTGEKLHFMDKILSPEKPTGKDGDNGQPVKKISSPVLSPPPASDYVNWLEANADDLPVEDGTKNRLKHQELIDTFIENENKQRGNRLNFVTEKKSGENEQVTESDAFDKIALDDSYFTETLARVYVNQKRYDKALEIIRVLSLKYPKKNIYFADQIRYLEKIINIKR